MEFLFELLFQFFGELLLQFLVEVGFEQGLRWLGRVLRWVPTPPIAAAWVTLGGVAAGGFSLLVMPHSAIHDPALRLVNLLGTPVLSGAAMTLIGRLRVRKGQSLVRLDRFGYAFLFAFTMALMRYNWAA
ncbi:hypothetical protein MTR62_10620 [Novosphingobium sp. 1949]|uniref:Uncharacterized protein n=1 Tax=Novosphingobium organovorum TaxID=2930092 RepID=A0ABT0BDI4_9SPHN|nr:hypothetical protein [Novosphingobium organovorum]MCJ2183141.1 hypothetical protein [Novosphingobium organovorum]